jgi:hypothetical protein
MRQTEPFQAISERVRSALWRRQVQPVPRRPGSGLERRAFRQRPCPPKPVALRCHAASLVQPRPYIQCSLARVFRSFDPDQVYPRQVVVTGLKKITQLRRDVMSVSKCDTARRGPCSLLRRSACRVPRATACASTLLARGSAAAYAAANCSIVGQSCDRPMPTAPHRAPDHLHCGYRQSTGSVSGKPDGVDAAICAITTQTDNGAINGGAGGAGAVGVSVSNLGKITPLTNSKTIGGGGGGVGPILRARAAPVFRTR